MPPIDAEIAVQRHDHAIGDQLRHADETGIGLGEAIERTGRRVQLSSFPALSINLDDKSCEVDPIV